MRKFSAFLLFIGIILSSPAIRAKTWIVDQRAKNGIKRFADLDQDKFKPGDIVIVEAGVYKETLTAISGVEFRARGSVQVEKIDIFSVTGAKIRGFRLDGEGTRDTGISIDDSQNVLVADCRLSGFFEAVSVSGARNLTLRGMLLEDNDHTIMIMQSKNVRVERSLIGRRPRPLKQDNAGAFGLEIDSSENIVVDHNTIVRNTHTAFAARESKRITLTNNIIAFNGWGLYFVNTKSPRLVRNLFYGNRKGNEVPPESRNDVPVLIRGLHFYHHPGFLDADKGDWRLRRNADSAFADSEGSHLGAFAPPPDPREENAR
jgi:parallel beta-helix repeat protein